MECCDVDMTSRINHSQAEIDEGDPPYCRDSPPWRLSSVTLRCGVRVEAQKMGTGGTCSAQALAFFVVVWIASDRQLKK